MLYLFINVNIFIIYYCFNFFSNFILETLYSFNIIFRKSNYLYINKNKNIFLYKLLIVIKLLI